MSTKAGQLLWNRKRITLQPGSRIFNTDLQQVNRAFNNSSDSEPPLGVVSAAPVANGTEPASRIQVIPMSPLSEWNTVTHGEPYVDETTGLVFVQFDNSAQGQVTINVLFWDPHTSIGPGQVDTYRAGPQS
jgi:hypothetical protein